MKMRAIGKDMMSPIETRVNGLLESARVVATADAPDGWPPATCFPRSSRRRAMLFHRALQPNPRCTGHPAAASRPFNRSFHRVAMAATGQDEQHEVIRREWVNRLYDAHLRKD